MLNELHFFFDEFLVFRGVLFTRGFVFHQNGMPVGIRLIVADAGPVAVAEDQVGLPSPDIQKRYGEQHSNCRFDIRLPLRTRESRSDACKDIKVEFFTGNGRCLVETPSKYKIALDQFSTGGTPFREALRACAKGTMLEIGSRKRSGIDYRELFPEHLDYVGFDTVAGSNVDVVGDAHHLSKYFPPESFDFVYSTSTFEHLLMPWQVALEMNKIMKTGALAYISSPQTWPTHDEPCDYFRFSRHAWTALFNKHTGFEILESAQGLPAHIVPMLYLDNQILDDQPGWMMSSVVARKISVATQQWTVDPTSITDDFYPV